MIQTQALTTAPANNNIMARIPEFQTVAKLFAASKLFTDVEGEAQCFVKILAGAELGIPPFTAMNAFHIIKGKPSMTANTIAARIKASGGRYDFHVIEKTSKKCTVDFLEYGKVVHTETWDMARAQMAGVQNLNKYPDAMLFARCITAGARVVAPDVVGQFYTPEEMGAQVNEEGEIIQGTTREIVKPVVADPVVKAAADLGGVVRNDAPVGATERTKAAMHGSVDSSKGDQPFGGTPARQGPPWPEGATEPAPDKPLTVDEELAAIANLQPGPRRTAYVTMLRPLAQRIKDAGMDAKALEVSPDRNDTFDTLREKIIEAHDFLTAVDLAA